MQIIPASPVLETGVTAPPAAPAAKPALVAAQSLAPVAKPLATQSRDVPVGSKPEAVSQTQPVKPANQTVISPQTQPVKPASQTVISPQTQPVKPAPQPSLQTAVLRLTFDEDSWVEIRGKDDHILSSQVNLRGSELRVSGQAPFSLVIGHAASVHLYHKGKQVDLTPHTSSSSEVARLTLE
jgi:cytoskeleton protein RodZ